MEEGEEAAQHSHHCLACGGLEPEGEVEEG